MITLDQKSVTININAAKADLQSAIAKAKKADLDYERAKELLARDYIAKATYDETEANKDMAHAAVDACKAALADAERLYGYLPAVFASTTLFLISFCVRLRAFAYFCHIVG